jgi:acetoin utilization protein AcuB
MGKAQKAGRTVESFMTRDVFKVGMDDSIGTMREILKHEAFHHLLVVKNRKLVGILSDRDIVKSISPFLDTLSETTRDVGLLDRKVHQFMTHKPITVTKDTSVGAAASLLLNNNISCLPVVSSDNEVEGVVTWRDILREYVEEREA